MQTMFHQKRYVHIVTVVIVSAIISILWTSKIRASTALIQMTVNNGTVSIDAGGTLNLWSILASTTTGTLSGQYGSIAFRVSDFKGSTGGYMTTIQSTALTGDIGWIVQTIAASNIYIKAWGTPTLMAGQSNPNISFGAVINSETYTSLGSPVQYIQKDSLGTTWGIVSTYGDKPWIRIDVPPYQPATSYQATLTFTLTSS